MFVLNRMFYVILYYWEHSTVPKLMLGIFDDFFVLINIQKDAFELILVTMIK